MGFGTSKAGVAAFGNAPSLLGSLGSSYVGHWVGDVVTLGDWHVIGPFDWANGRAYDIAYAPEKGPIDLKATYDGVRGKVSVEPVDRAALPTLKRDPQTGEYRPG